jgi:hypothetical protein
MVRRTKKARGGYERRRNLMVAFFLKRNLI